MLSEKKFIKDVSAFEKFQSIYRYYSKIIIGIVLSLFVIGFIPGIIFQDIVLEVKTLLILIIIVSAIVIAPFKIFILAKEKLIIWISALIIIIIIFMIQLYGIFQNTGNRIFSGIFPLIIYSVYCYSLNFQIGEWLSEYYGHQSRLEQKKQKEDEIKRGLFE